jgi:hypothetical protein
MVQLSYGLLGVGVVGALLLLYLLNINQAMKEIPEEAQKLSPHRWTRDEVRAMYEKVKKKPVDFTPYIPPKQDRRYIVIGGSGLVGEPPSPLVSINLMRNRRLYHKSAGKSRSRSAEYPAS